MRATSHTKTVLTATPLTVTPPTATSTSSTERTAHALAWCREFFLDLLALLWPTSCVGCGCPDRELCNQCATEVLDVSSVDPEEFGIGAGGRLPCYVAGPYTGTVRAALVAYKHQGLFGLARPLGRRMGAVLRAACAAPASEVRAPPVLVTIPSRPARVRERGYRHLDELVRVAVRHERLPLEIVAALKVLPGRTGQVGLDAASRETNAQRISLRRGTWMGTGKLMRKLRTRDVILVDDIVTTGATLRAASKVLERAGARVVAVVALCAVVRKDTPEKLEWKPTGKTR
ncbi:MAG: ComF family protein [Leucobacter sp.]